MKNFRKLEHVGTTWSLEQRGHEFVPKLPSAASLLSPAPLPSLPPFLSSTKTMHPGPTTRQTPPALGQSPTATEEKEHRDHRVLSCRWGGPVQHRSQSPLRHSEWPILSRCTVTRLRPLRSRPRLGYFTKPACESVCLNFVSFQFASVWISEVYFYYCKKWRMFSVHILSGCLQKRLLYHLALVSWSRFYFSLILPEVQHIQPLLQI